MARTAAVELHAGTNPTIGGWNDEQIRWTFVVIVEIRRIKYVARNKMLMLQNTGMDICSSHSGWRTWDTALLQRQLLGSGHCSDSNVETRSAPRLHSSDTTYHPATLKSCSFAPIHGICTSLTNSTYFFQQL